MASLNDRCRSWHRRVGSVVAAITTPLIFSSRDAPGNFLAAGHRVTAFLDFAWAGFADPLLGIATYWTDDWYPLNRAGLVERYLAAHGLTRHDFALGWQSTACGHWGALAVADTRIEYRERLVSLLQRALAWME